MEDLVYLLDYRDILNCARLAQLIWDRSGQEKTMEMHVRPEHDLSARPIPAKTVANPVGRTLSVSVTTGAGQQSINAGFDDVLYGLSQTRPERKG